MNQITQQHLCHGIVSALSAPLQHGNLLALDLQAGKKKKEPSGLGARAIVELPKMNFRVL